MVAKGQKAGQFIGGVAKLCGGGGGGRPNSKLAAVMGLLDGALEQAKSSLQQELQG